MDIFQAILLFVVGFFAGGQFTLNAIRDLSQRELAKYHLPKSEFITHLNIEQINNLYYIFDVKTNTFVCQGNTLEATLNILLDRGIDRALITFDEQRFAMKDGTIIELPRQS